MSDEEEFPVVDLTTVGEARKFQLRVPPTDKEADEAIDGLLTDALHAQLESEVERRARERGGWPEDRKAPAIDAMRELAGVPQGVPLTEAGAKFMAEVAMRSKQRRADIDTRGVHFNQPLWNGDVAHIDGEEVVSRFTRELLEAHASSSMRLEAQRRMPHWAGSPSIGLAFEACYQGTIVEWLTDSIMSPAGVAYTHGLTQLPNARPIVVPDDQQRVLPRPLLSELAPWAASLRLPFPVTYLDLVDPDPATPLTEVRVPYPFDETPEGFSRSEADLRTAVVGALCWGGGRPLDEDDEDALPPLNILPVICWRLGERPKSGVDLEILAHVLISRGSQGQVFRGIEHEGTLNGVPARHFGAGFFYEHAGEPTRASVAVRLGEQEEGPGSPAAISVATSAAAYDLGETSAEQRRSMERQMGLLSAGALTYILGVLYFLDSHNVEVVEAQLHRRDRKRAEKRKWPIASTVAVRRRLTRRPTSVDGGGASREYSHQFEVEAHYKHVQRGPHVRCPTCKGEGRRKLDAIVLRCKSCKGTGLNAEKVKPCARTDQHGQLTCPNGCRREWVPEHIKGPADKPLVPKARVVKFTNEEPG